MFRRQDHVMIELLCFRQHRIPQSDEVDNVSVLIERALDARSHGIVVTVNPLADITGERNEVRGRENELLFRHIDAKDCLAHSDTLS